MASCDDALDETHAKSQLMGAMVELPAIVERLVGEMSRLWSRSTRPKTERENGGKYIGAHVVFREGAYLRRIRDCPGGQL